MNNTNAKPPNFTRTTSRWGKPMLIIDSSYIFNLHKKNKDDSELYYCNESITFKKCPAYIKLKKDKFIEYSNEHNHPVKFNAINHGETRKKLENKIKNPSDPFSIKVPKLIKSVSVGKGIRYPSYINLKSSLYKEVNSIIYSDINSFEEFH